jgi:hypothetical protein
MRRLAAAALATVAFVGWAASAPGPTAHAQTSRDLSRIVGALGGRNLTSADASAGLKEALTNAAGLVGTRLAAQNGYFGDNQIRIPLPGVLGQAQTRLKPFGMAGSLDDLQLRMNRAAEAAAPEAKRLVVQAISSMTIEDGLTVLRGGETSATDFLRGKTTANLTTALRPYVTRELQNAGALTALDRTVARYGAGLAPPDARGWLTDKAVAGALDGLFYYVAQEERAIRRDPAKRTSDLLRRVFGS